MVYALDLKSNGILCREGSSPSPGIFLIKFMYYVYVLKCINSGKIYVGRSDNLKRRYSEHLQGKVWTTSRILPVKLIFYEAFLSKEDSIRREKYFKSSKGKSSLRQIIRNSLNIDLPNTT